MSWEPKIIHLPGTELTPEVVLHRTLTKKERIQAVTVVILWDDGTYDVDWSRQELRDLAMGAMTLTAHTERELFR